VVCTFVFGRWFANPDAHAHEVLGLEVLRDRAQPVVAGEAAANLDAHDAGLKI